MDEWDLLQKLREECLDSSSDDESEQTTQLMVSAATILHEHHSREMPVYGGSRKGRDRNVPRNRVGGHARLFKDYFHPTNPV